VRFSVDKIKIDRNFVKGVPSGNREVAITCAIIAMGDHKAKRMHARMRPWSQSSSIIAARCVSSW
ncbi:MAG TPA: hypothetical protein PKY96_17175, partial [Flavobacteriales bacterium]|nr:hypothetical protein [Flavobacteriales bacterium]